HPVGQDLDHRLPRPALQLRVHVHHPALKHSLAGVLVHRRGPAAGVLVVVLASTIESGTRWHPCGNTSCMATCNREPFLRAIALTSSVIRQPVGPAGL